MKFRILVCLMFGLFISVFNVSHASGQFFFLENPLIGRQAPDFTLTTVKGETKNMTEFRDGKSAVIFFWATWCPHCRRQLKGLNEYAESFEKKDIKIILLDIGEDAQTVGSYLKKNDIKFEVFLDQKSVLAEEYGIVGVPTFYLVDKNGIIQKVEHFLPEDYEKILAMDGEQENPGS